MALKRQITITLLILLGIFLLVPICYGETTKSFQMSVYIPPIVGVNVDENGVSLRSRLKKESAQDTTIEQVVRNEKPVQLKTIVGK